MLVHDMDKGQVKLLMAVPHLKLCRSGTMPRPQHAALSHHLLPTAFHTTRGTDPLGEQKCTDLHCVFLKVFSKKLWSIIFPPYKAARGNFFVLQPKEGDIRTILFAPGSQIIINMLSSANSPTCGTGACAVNITASLQGSPARQSLHWQIAPGFCRFDRIACKREWWHFHLSKNCLIWSKSLYKMGTALH